MELAYCLLRTKKGQNTYQQNSGDVDAIRVRDFVNRKGFPATCVARKATGRLLQDEAGRMTSVPAYGRSASGTTTEPSFCW